MSTVHVTERQAFKTCRLYHNYAYTRKLVPLYPMAYGNARWFGVGIHYALATYYKHDGKMPPAHAFNVWYNQQGRDEPDMHLLGMEMLTGYLPYAREHDNWDVVGVEHKVSHTIEPGITLTGTLDLLVRDKTYGKLWVVDHKTCAQFVDPEALIFDDQMIVYLWLVWRQYGEVPGGAIYSMLRKQAPAEPYVLKNGQLSKAKNIDTTPERYLRAIEHYGLNRDDYADVLARVAANEFFRREKVAHSARELQTLDSQLLAEAREMTRPDVAVYPTMSQDCLWRCSYRDLCRTRLTGGDVEYMIGTAYQTVEDYDQRWLPEEK